MRETKERYYEAMRDAAIRRIIAVDDEVDDEEAAAVVAPYKYPGRTEFAARFLRNRCKLAEQYYLSHRLIRSIVARARLLLPEVLCDLGRYHGYDFLDFDR